MRLFHRSSNDDSKRAGPARRIRTVVIDDHPIIHEALAIAFGSRPDLLLCGSARSSEEALALVERARPDVAVVDLSLGEEHGVDLIKTLHEKYPRLRMVVFSLYDEQVYAERTLWAGASAYVMKDEPTGTLIEAVRRVHLGGVFVSPQMTNVIERSRFSVSAVLPKRPIEAEDVEPVLAVTERADFAETSRADRSAFSLSPVTPCRPPAGQPLGGVARLLQSVTGWGVPGPEIGRRPFLAPIHVPHK